MPLSLIAMLVIVLVVKPYEFFYGRPLGTRMTRLEIANVIDRAATERVGDAEWDDFSCVPIRNEGLDAARLRCVEIVETDLPSGKISKEQARQILSALAQDVRDRRLTDGSSGRAY